MIVNPKHPINLGQAKHTVKVFLEIWEKHVCGHPSVIANDRIYEMANTEAYDALCAVYTALQKAELKALAEREGSYDAL